MEQHDCSHRHSIKDANLLTRFPRLNPVYRAGFGVSAALFVVLFTDIALADAPLTTNDAFGALEGGSIGGTPNVLSNDSDPEFGALTANLLSGPSRDDGSFSLSTNGNVSYTHDGSETTSDTFTYEACDTELPQLCTSAVVNITITPVNDLPTAVNDGPFSIQEGGSVTGPRDVLNNDNDPDGDSLTAVLVSGPSNDSNFSLNSNGNFNYAHDGSETTSDSFTYRANDGTGNSNIATVSISITLTDDGPPIAVNDGPFNAPEGGSVTGSPNVLSNDSDPDGDSMTAVLVSGPTNESSFNLNSNGNFSYSHDGSETTSDSFTYRANDGTGNSNVATVSIAVAPVNDGVPTAVNDGPFNIQEGGSVGGSPNVLNNDSDPDDDPMTAVLVSGPANESSFNLNSNGAFSYTHDGSETTSDSFTYRANDGTGNSNIATVSISISSVNDGPPTAVNDGPYNATEGGSVAGSPNVLANDSDPDGDTMTAVLVSNPSNDSSFNLNSNGTFTYTHDGSETTSDSFTYRASDGSGNSNVATVSLAISPVDDGPPIALNDGPFTAAEGGSIAGSPNVLSNDSDPDGDSMTAVLVSGPANGSGFNLSSNGTFTYTHNGGETLSDSFTYRANDGNGNSNVATVSITITPQNDLPLAANDGPFNVQEGGSVSGLPNVLGNDSDPDGDSLIAVLVSGPSNASSFNLGNNGSFNYAHNGGETTSDSFSYRANDGTGSSNIATVSITITPVNDPPVAAADNYSANEGGSVPGSPNVLDNDLDPDGPNLRVTLVGQSPGNANSFNLNANGSFSYTHDGSETASDSFTYEVCDGGSPQECDTAVVTIDIDPVNDLPVIQSQAGVLSTAEDTALLITLADITATDEDNTYPDDFTLLVRDGADYTVAGDSITPATDFNGPLSVSVSVNDGSDDSEAFQLTIDVTPVNDAPKITAQLPLETPEDSSLVLQATDLTVFDPDNSYPTGFTTTILPGENYTAAANAITPDLNFNGNLFVPVVVNDGLLDSAQFTLSVQVAAVNDAPLVATPIGDQQAVENAFFELDLTPNFADVDGDTLTFSATGLPAPFVLDAQTGIISGTPAFEDTKDLPFSVAITATDDSGEFASEVFPFTVAALGRANVGLSISAAPDPAMLNDQVQWTFTAGNTGPEAAMFLELNGSFVGQSLSVATVGGVNCVIQAAVGQVSDFTCTLNDVPNGGSTSAVLATTTGAAGDIFVTATATITEALPIDPNLINNSLQATVGVAETFSNGNVQTLGSAVAGGFAVGDVDGDGFVDLVVGTAAGQSVEIYLSTGSRTFVEAPTLVPDNSLTQGVALADVDGDADLDLILANGGGQPDVVYANDGTGAFSLIATLEISFSRDVAAADINNDGNIDLAFAAVAGNPVYIGDGSGGFTLRDTLGTANSNAVAVADIDGDTWPDLVFANVGSDSTVWLSTSGNGFSAPAPVMTGDVADVVAVDLDGNGSIDLAFARISGLTGDVPSNPVFLNDGSGGMTLLTTLGAAATSGIYAGDVDEDGIVDLVFVNESGVHQIWQGSGTGFALYSEQIVALNGRCGALADLGNDGGLDLAIGGEGQAGTDIFLNDGFGNLGKGDAVVPVLTLVGEASVDVPSGQAYLDAGATADDNIDGDLTPMIVVTNTVNTAIVGTYTVTYNVTDDAGNPAIPILRSINVLPAAGSGGGGGGASSLLWMFILTLFTMLAAYRANRAIICVSRR